MPMYAMAAVAIYGAIQGARKSKQEKQAAAMTAQMQKLAQNQHSMAEPAMQQAMRYYTQLAMGDRNQINTTLAPQISQLNSYYSGAERGMLAHLPPGPTRDRQLAEMKREQAGKVGMMPFMARQNANEQLGNLGNQGINNAMNAYQGMMPGLNFLQQAQDQRNQNWTAVGETLGNMFAPYIANMEDSKWFGGGKKNNGGSDPLYQPWMAGY